MTMPIFSIARRLPRATTFFVAILAFQTVVLVFADDQPVEITDSAEAVRKFTDDLAKLLKEGQAVGLADLRKQLPDEQTCAVSALAPTDQPVDLPKLYTVCRQSVVLVGMIYKCGKCDNWHTSVATGFIISRDGVVVTNHHVLASEAPNAAIAVGTWDGRVLPIQKVLAASKANDLAVIKVGADDLVPVPVAPLAPVGTEVLVIGHPVNHLYMMSSGIVSSHFLRRERGKTTSRHQMTITADYAKGSSGSPILDRSGNVVGIACSTTPIYYERKDGVDSKIQMVMKYCIPSVALLELLGQSASDGVDSDASKHPANGE